MENLGFQEEEQVDGQLELNVSIDSQSESKQNSNLAECSVDLGSKGAIPKKSTQVRRREPRMIHCRDGVISEDEIGKLYEQFDEPLSKVSFIFC